MGSHSRFAAHQFAFLFTVIENVWLAKILIFRFLTLLCHLCSPVKGWGGKANGKVFWTDLENTITNAKLSEHLQFGCATASPALELPWNENNWELFSYLFLLFSHHILTRRTHLCRGGSAPALKASFFSFAAHRISLTWYSLTLSLKQVFNFLFDLSVFQRYCFSI